MDPVSVISMAGACLTLVTRTVKDVNDLVGKFRNMDQKISYLGATQHHQSYHVASRDLAAR